MMLYGQYVVDELTRRLVRATHVMRDVARMLTWYEGKVARLGGQLADAVSERELAIEAALVFRKSLECVVLLWDEGQIGARGESAEALQALSDNWHRTGR